ncbi:MAG: GC-type dockerin domain-anchored protein, partial [Phycisphaerales bacterium]
TYGEWSKSLFAQGPVDVGGRFGGILPAVSSCQDCHMPPTEGRSCFFGEERTDLRPHYFNGGNTWVLKAVRSLYPDMETGLSEQSVADSIARTTDMLQKASDMELSLVAPDRLRVRVINQSGHKLPTGYPEGRRMWINVRCFDGDSQLVYEYGQYDNTTAVLHGYNTEVYEAKIGVDAEVSAATGVPVGPSFHFALNNTWYKDNRIPPRGFTNAGFAEVQAAPVAATYADGQHWDDTEFTIVPGTASVEVRVFFQTTSKEYIEFLRDANTTNAAGQIAYDQWVAQGKSAPVEMDFATIAVPCYANCDASVTPPVLNVNDFTCFLNKYAAGDTYANCDGSTTPPVLNVNDFVCFLNAFAGGCP